MSESTKDFEHIILSAAMDYGDEAMDSILTAGCKVEWFTYPATISTWNAIYRVFRAKETLGYQIVASELDDTGELERIGGRRALLQILEVGPNSETFLKQALEITRSEWLLRTARNIGTKLEASDTLEDAQAILGPMVAGFEADVAGTSPIQDMKSLTRGWVDIFERRKEGRELSAMPTGIQELDDRWGGIINPGLTIISALPSSGKTALATQLIVALCERGNHAAFFSLEMCTQPQVMDRIMCIAAGLNPSAIYTADPLTKGEMIQIEKATQRVAAYNLEIEDHAGMTADYITTKARSIHRKDPLNLVVVDFAQIIKGQRIKGDSHERELAYVASSMQELAKELSCSVVLLSQVNPAGGIKGATAFEEAADLWLHIIREKGAEFDQGIGVKKCRHRGQNGQILNLSFSKETLKFEHKYHE